MIKPGKLALTCICAESQLADTNPEWLILRDLCDHLLLLTYPPTTIPHFQALWSPIMLSVRSPLLCTQDQFFRKKFP